MASYLQSFLAKSSMPKRLLYYALSRLEIVDTEALDLESLDITWGKKNIFEFTDVALRLKASLHLPIVAYMLIVFTFRKSKPSCNSHLP